MRISRDAVAAPATETITTFAVKAKWSMVPAWLHFMLLASLLLLRPGQRTDLERGGHM